jgi:cold shock CspA family protein
MTTMQATVATFVPQTNSGTVLLDDGTQLSFDATAFLRSGLRMLRLGQRVKVVVLDGKIQALTHISFNLQ